MDNNGEKNEGMPQSSSIMDNGETILFRREQKHNATLCQCFEKAMSSDFKKAKKL